MKCIPSSFDSEDNIRMLYRQLRKSVGSDIFISVRKPQQIRYILSEDKYEELCTAAVSNTGVKTVFLMTEFLVLIRILEHLPTVVMVSQII